MRVRGSAHSELDEMVARPTHGRVFEGSAVVRLADVGIDGRLRLDALARVLQDVATDDAADSALPGGFWVLRRCAVRLESAARLGEELALATWCSGTGPRWAERRTDVACSRGVVAQSVAVWVHVDRSTLQPAHLPEGFAPLYSTSASGRRVSSRLRHPPVPPAGVASAPWPLRSVDFDVLGHVNNAVYWAPLVEELARARIGRVERAEVEFRAGLDAGDEPEVVSVHEPGAIRLWIVVAGEVRATLLAQHC